MSWRFFYNSLEPSSLIQAENNLLQQAISRQGLQAETLPTMVAFVMSIPARGGIWRAWLRLLVATRHPARYLATTRFQMLRATAPTGRSDSGPHHTPSVDLP